MDKPDHEQFDAPAIEQDKFPLSKFERVRLTFGAHWTHKFDQAGVLLVIASEHEKRDSWIKCGLEMFNGVPNISFVGCDRWADWSIAPLNALDSSRVTVELARDDDTLWAYELVLDKSGNERSRHPIRECAWPFSNIDAKTVTLSFYAARPAPQSVAGDELLEVSFYESDIKRAK